MRTALSEGGCLGCGRWSRALALAIILLAGGCTFDAVTPDRRLSIDFKDTQASLSANGVANSVDLKPYLSAQGAYALSLLFSSRRNGFTYLLLDGGGRSSADDTGPCASGSEENFIWLKLDAAFKIADAKSELVESCRSNVHGQQSYTILGNQLTMKYVRTAVGTEGAAVTSTQYQSVLTYDNDNPEAGMKIETKESR